MVGGKSPAAPGALFCPQHGTYKAGSETSGRDEKGSKQQRKHPSAACFRGGCHFGDRNSATICFLTQPTPCRSTDPMGRAAPAAPAVLGTGRAALPLPVGLFPFVVICSLLVVGYRLGGRQTQSGRSTPPKKYIYIYTHTKIQRYGSHRACSDAVLWRILPSLASQGARLLPAAHAASAARTAICAGCGGRLPSQGGNWPAAPRRDKVSAARGLGSSWGGGGEMPARQASWYIAALPG